MKQNDKIKTANKKALPAFILMMVVCGIVGGVIGFFAAVKGTGSLTQTIQAAGRVFAGTVAPWLLVAMGAILPAVAIPLYKDAQKLLANWDGEDESVCDKAESKISLLIWLTGAALILALFLIAAAYSVGPLTPEKEVQDVRSILIGCIGFTAVLAESVLLQQKAVDAAKKTNPEKADVSVYDMKFRKKWLDSCDEAEKQMIAQAAFKAYNAANMVCAALAILLALSALVFGIGFLPSLSVCTVWLVNHTAYCFEAMKASSPRKG